MGCRANRGSLRVGEKSKGEGAPESRPAARG